MPKFRGVGARTLPRGVGSEVRARGTLDLRLREIAGDVQVALEESAEEVLRVAKDNCPVSSGELRDVLYISMLEERGYLKWRIEIIAPKSYAAAQERGSGLQAERLPGVVVAPIPILPKRGKVLIFEWHGNLMHLARVIHPGVPPTRFMRDALKETTTSIWTRILRASSGQGA